MEVDFCVRACCVELRGFVNFGIVLVVSLVFARVTGMKSFGLNFY